MATYSRIQDIVKSFGLDEDYAYVIYETYQAHCGENSKTQWAALQHNLKEVGLKAELNAFNAYNQVSMRVIREENNRLSSGV